MNNRDVFFISLFTFLTVVIWVVADAYHSFVTSSIPAPLQRAMTPINPKLDTAIIQNLKKRGEIIKETPLIIPTAESSLSANIASASPTLVLSPSVAISIPSPTIPLTPTITPGLSPTLVPSPTP